MDHLYPASFNIPSFDDYRGVFNGLNPSKYGDVSEYN
jgi:hypothetical protein